MKNLLTYIIALLFIGCSSNSDDEPSCSMSSVQFLGVAVEVLYINEPNRIAILPKDDSLVGNEFASEYKRHIASVEYFLDDRSIGMSNVFPFEIHYSIDEEKDHVDLEKLPMIKSLTAKPTLKTNVCWEPKDKDVKILKRETEVKD